MPRPPQVTRHITHTECVCKCVDTSTGTIFGKIVNLPRFVSQPKRRLQLCRQKIEKDNVHILLIENVRYLKSFVLQTEIQFLEQGKLLSQSTIKANEIANERED